MFVLQKISPQKSGNNTRYFMAAGYKGNVMKQIQKQRTNDNQESSMDKILEIHSDIKIINELKSSYTKIFQDIEKKEINHDEKTLMGSVLLEFLKTHECGLQNFRVCRKCRKMVNKDGNEMLGYIFLGDYEIGDLLRDWMKRDWACDECRVEFALVAWTESASKKEYCSVIVAKREDIEQKLTLLIREHTRVYLILNICPSYDDETVCYRVKDNFQRVNKCKDSKYPIDCINKQTLCQSFIDYYCDNGSTKDNLIRICDKCALIFLNASTESIGSISLDISELTKMLKIESGWICEACGVKPSFSLLTLSCKAGDAQYYMKTSEEDKCERSSANKSTEVLIKMNPCVELYSKKVEPTVLKEKICKSLGVKPKENQFTLNMTSKELVSKILKIFMKQFRKRGRTFQLFSQEESHFKICTYCQHIFYNGEELGYFWVCRTTDLEERFKSNYICPFHEIHSILYWNMTGWNTISKIENQKKDKQQIQVFKNSDVICLIETHLTPDSNISFPEFLNNRNKLYVSAQKPSRGRGKGGLMLLIKDNIMFRQKRLEFSNKGLFTQLQFETHSLIIGVIYWRPEPGEENLDDWLKELDNFINVHKSKEIKFIIGGDFNGRIGKSDAQTVETENSLLKVTRQSSDKMENKRGRLLLKLMKDHGFILCNGRTKSDKTGRFTSHTVNGESVVDYIWISPNCIPIVEDMAVIDVESQSADYHRGLSLLLKKTNHNFPD